MGVALSGGTTSQDTVVFGLVTTQSDASILHVSSATTNDFLEFKLVWGGGEVIMEMGVNWRVDGCKWRLVERRGG